MVTVQGIFTKPLVLLIELSANLSVSTVGGLRIVMVRFVVVELLSPGAGAVVLSSGG
jgi:hypothetical protein